MKKNKGYTLIEIMVTIFIFATLLSYALPNIINFRLNNIMINERNRLTSSLNFARNNAIMNHIYTLVCPSESGTGCDAGANWHKGWIVFNDYNRNRELDTSDTLLRYESAMEKEIEATSSIYRKKIRYDTMGFSPGTNVTINFCDSRGHDYGKNLIINNVGRARQSNTIAANVCI